MAAQPPPYDPSAPAQVLCQLHVIPQKECPHSQVVGEIDLCKFKLLLLLVEFSQLHLNPSHTPVANSCK